MRLGSTRFVKTNARIIAATNCDLFAVMRSGTFREEVGTIVTAATATAGF
jgi:transcriptional regulator with GAF, ATPase, and Fis domain